MFKQLIDTVSSFSMRTVLKTNIIANPGSSFGSTYSSVSLGNGARSGSVSNHLSNLNSLSGYYLKLQELAEYRNTELTNIVLTIYKDYIINYFNPTDNIIEFTDDVTNRDLAQTRVNKIFKQIGIVQEIKDHIEDYFFNGSYAFKLSWSEEDKVYKKYNLANPSSVITVSEGNVIPKSYLVVSKQGTIFEVSPYSIIQIGRPTLRLFNDVNDKFFSDSKEDSLVEGVRLSTPIPLYYNNSGKIKEFLLKDQIVSLLSIKDLIQPLLLLLRVDNNTSPDEANKLALNIENLINKYADISSILSANFSINELMDALINNIRVLPDYGSGMGEMNNVDLSKIADKISQFKSDQENSRELILNGLAIPRALFAGESTKWDAIKSSQRLNSRIDFYVKDITDSIVQAAIILHYMTTGEILTREQIKCNLFKKTDADYNTELTNSDIINQLVDQIGRIIESSARMLKDQELIEPKEYMAFVKSKLISIDPEIENILPDKTINAYIKKILEERSSSGSGSGHMGGW